MPGASPAPLSTRVIPAGEGCRKTQVWTDCAYSLFQILQKRATLKTAALGPCLRWTCWSQGPASNLPSSGSEPWFQWGTSTAHNYRPHFAASAAAGPDSGQQDVQRSGRRGPPRIGKGRRGSSQPTPPNCLSLFSIISPFSSAPTLTKNTDCSYGQSKQILTRITNPLTKTY